jgi:hypothetical protein
MTEDDAGRTQACHGLLLGLAGRIPDNLITRCREQLAAGELTEMARSVMFCLLSLDLTLPRAGQEVLRSVLDDPPALADLETADPAPVTWRFSPEPPTAEEPAALTVAVAGALAREAGAIGCWLAWRTGPSGTPPAPATPVFVVETQPGTDLVGVTGRLQQHLAAAGETSPQVEVYSRDREPPVYQQQARGYGELIWAAAEDPGLRIAGIFDEVDPEHGPRFHPSHPRLDAAEAAQIARYLSEAEPVLITAKRMDDVLDPARVYCVPISFRTDGTWIWTEAAAYYAQQHLLEPDPELLAHVRANRHTLPVVDGVALHRALETLMRPQGEQVWDLDRPPGPDSGADQPE